MDESTRVYRILFPWYNNLQCNWCNGDPFQNFFGAFWNQKKKFCEYVFGFLLLFCWRCTLIHIYVMLPYSHSLSNFRKILGRWFHFKQIKTADAIPFWRCYDWQMNCIQNLLNFISSEWCKCTYIHSSFDINECTWVNF